MKEKLPDYKPSRRQVATAIGILVLAAAGFGYNAIDTGINPDTNQSQPVNNTDNVTDVNQSRYYDNQSKVCRSPDTNQSNTSQIDACLNKSNTSE